MQRFTGIQYLKIDMANSFGLDKENWDDRIKWFDQNEHQLIDIVQDSEDPAMFYAAYQAWNAAKAGEPSGYPISLDATSSGMQVLAALTGDRAAALLCNVLNTGDREDAYTNIFDIMTEHLLKRLGELAGTISREDCKDAIMTSLFGSVAVPKEVFGEGIQLRVFYEVMAECAPAVWELNEAFLSMWDPTAYSHDWVLPDNFHVKVKVEQQVSERVQFMNEPYDTFHTVNEPKEEGRSLGANCTHSVDGMIVREMVRRCDYDLDTVLRVVTALDEDKQGSGSNRAEDKQVEILWDHYEQTGYLSARILDYLDQGNIGMVLQADIWELINSLPEKPFKIMCVHDCFRVLPNYGNDLRWQYNNQLMLVARSSLLQNLLSQIVGRELKIGKLDESMWKDIPFTNYALS